MLNNTLHSYKSKYSWHKFSVQAKKEKHWKVPLLPHALDILQVTAWGNKGLQAKNVLPHVPAWGEFSLMWETRWKPFGAPCLHSFLLKSPHKPTHRCCNINLFPLLLPPAVPRLAHFFYFSLEQFLYGSVVFQFLSLLSHSEMCSLSKSLIMSHL